MTTPAGLRWSNSSLQCLQQCGERYRRRYIERDFVPRSPRQVRGTVVHKVASIAYLQKYALRTLPSVEQTRDTAADAFEAEWRSGVLLSAEEAEIGAARVEADSKDFAVDLAGFHVEAVAPAITPVGVERKIIVKPKDSDLEINGVIDLIDATPAGEVIRDLKTAEKSPVKSAAEDSMQLSFYAMIRQAEVGHLPKELALDYLVRTPSKHERKHVPLVTTRGPEDVASLVHRINVAVEAVKKGIFVPASPDAWYCSRAYCEYFESCPYVRRSTRPQN